VPLPKLPPTPPSRSRRNDDETELPAAIARGPLLEEVRLITGLMKLYSGDICACHHKSSTNLVIVSDHGPNLTQDKRPEGMAAPPAGKPDNLRLIIVPTSK
jgi:hypothetical protein